MNILLIILVLTATFVSIFSAPADHLHDFEQEMLDKLNKPWLTPDKPPEYPRKGEYPCKEGVCKVVDECEDCQYAEHL